MKTPIRTHDERVASITGAGQGIGQAIALAFAGRGAKVIATDLEPPHETVRKIGHEALALQLDVTREEDWRSVAGKAQDLGDVDIVVNNAGYFPNRTIDDLDLATWRKTMATNLDSHFLSVKYFLPSMRKKKWGRFVGISSIIAPVSDRDAEVSDCPAMTVDERESCGDRRTGRSIARNGFCRHIGRLIDTHDLHRVAAIQSQELKLFCKLHHR